MAHGICRALTSEEEGNMRKTTSWMAGITVIAVTLATIVFLSPPVKADASAAEATYKAKCAMCHGPDGRSETATGKMMKVRDFSDVQKMSDADLTSVITSGKGKMPPYKTLSADQVKDLVAYIRAFGKKN
jgi:mono/diheme cytochrome c family protein